MRTSGLTVGVEEEYTLPTLEDFLLSQRPNGWIWDEEASMTAYLRQGNRYIPALQKSVPIIDLANLDMDESERGKGKFSRFLRKLIAATDHSIYVENVMGGDPERDFQLSDYFDRLIREGDSLGGNGQWVKMPSPGGFEFSPSFLYLRPNPLQNIPKGLGSINRSERSPIPISVVAHNEGGEEIGWAEGVVHYAGENVHNWAAMQKIDPEVMASIEPIQEMLPIGILKNLWVEEEYRGKGYGTELQQTLIDEAFAAGARTLILEADIGETTNPFVLEDWFRSFGFETIGYSSGYPIMVLGPSE